MQPASFTFSDENSPGEAQIAKISAAACSAVIAILWRVQDSTRLGLEADPRRCDLLDMAYIRVLEVATFYTISSCSRFGKKAHVRCAAPRRAACARRRHHRGVPEPNPPRSLPSVEDGNFSWEESSALAPA